jgi:hypothetical protein
MPKIIKYLPGYAWDSRMSYGGRFRRVLPDGKLGQLVSRAEIVAGLRTLNANSARLLADLAEDVVNGLILPSDFQQAAMVTLRNLYNANAALAKGGWLQMTSADFGANGQLLRVEYNYLRGFTADLAAGKLSVAQARSRASMYIGRAYSRFFAADVPMQQQYGKTEVLWVDNGDERECVDCEAEAAIGWRPIAALDSVPGAGAQRCGGLCRCGLEYR